MTEVKNIELEKKTSLGNENRRKLLEGLPVTEKDLVLTGISTPFLEGGDGHPIILLHGPGENVTWWMRTIPQLVTANRVIIPDLPGHGASEITKGKLDEKMILPWLNKLIEKTCATPPILVGHILGGSIAARFAIEHGSKIRQLVLVDSLGLGKFRPTFKFAFGLIRFLMNPTEKNYNRFLPQCMYDPDDLRNQMGDQWKLFIDYNIECANDPVQKEVLKLLMKKIGVPKIPSEELARIDVPTALIWGRHDRANKLQIAEKASERYGWPLEVIEEAADDPKLEQPEAFLRALYNVLIKDNGNSAD